MLDFRLGDRVKVTNHEFPSWRPTCATVIKLCLKFASAEPSMRREIVTVRLDEHPFPEQLWGEPMRDLGFDIDDPNYTLERLDECKEG